MEDKNQEFKCHKQRQEEKEMEIIQPSQSIENLHSGGKVDVRKETPAQWEYRQFYREALCIAELGDGTWCYRGILFKSDDPSMEDTDHSQNVIHKAWKNYITTVFTHLMSNKDYSIKPDTRFKFFNHLSPEEKAHLKDKEGNWREELIPD